MYLDDRYINAFMGNLVCKESNNFLGKTVTCFSSWTFLWGALREANEMLPKKFSSNYDENNLIRALNINFHPRRAPSITEVQWVPPSPRWIKVNTIGSAQGTPGPSGCGGIFPNYRCFVKGCFSQALVIGYAYEAEIMAFILAIEKVADFDWKNL